MNGEGEMRIFQAQGLRDDIASLREALRILTAEVSVLREVQARLSAQYGRPTYGMLILMASLVLAILVQSGYALRWSGKMEANQENIIEMVRTHVVVDGKQKQAPERDRW